MLEQNGNCGIWNYKLKLYEKNGTKILIEKRPILEDECT